MCPGFTSIGFGSSWRQISQHCGQRLWNAQPAGLLMGLAYFFASFLKNIGLGYGNAQPDKGNATNFITLYY